MKKLLFSILIFTSLSSFAVNSDIDIFIENHIEHFNYDSEGDEFASKAPESLIKYIRKFAESPIGKIVIRTTIENDVTVGFIQGFYVDDAFQAFDNTIVYTFEIEKWYENKLIEFPDLPKGANLHNIELDVLLAHEFGHTGVGRIALGLSVIDPYVSTSVSTGNVVTTFSRKKIRQEELRAARLFENAYRTFRNIPLRRSYYVENDVL
ncbi:hypothetical protein A9Q84_16140 [Halobacteriovorax marinus]|uniref:Peptidase M48 domain-containing protein n=1 Tax=Halobacteriovorax marinus TaxID=97084 RepID=A0A1Y5F4Q0_9BACT|nr:hypothetical protein A9Q84_16140 [Halobacteriovorax marinus]